MYIGVITLHSVICLKATSECNVLCSVRVH